MYQVASEKSQPPQTESAAEKKIHDFSFWKQGIFTKHTEKKTLYRAAGGTQKVKKKFSHFLKGGIFKASAWFSSPKLGLVSLRKTRMVHWPRTIIWHVLSRP